MREVGEQRAVEGDAVDTPLVEAVRRYLHRHRVAHRRDLNCASRRCSSSASGVVLSTGFKPRRETAPQRSDDRGLNFPQRKKMRKPLRAGGLAVGAGHAADPHRLRGAAVEFMREQTGLRLEALHARVRHAPCPFNCGVPGKAFPLPKDRRAAALDRLRDVAPAVARGAGPGEKSRAGGGAAAVGGQAIDRRPLACELRERGLNQVLSFASSPSPGISIGVSAAS